MSRSLKHLGLRALAIAILAIAVASVRADDESPPADVKVRTLDGKTIGGKLVRLSDKAIVVAAGGSEQSFAPQKLQSIVVRENAPASRAKVQVALLDGTQLHGSAYTASGGKGTITLADGIKQTVSTSVLASVRLRPMPHSRSNGQSSPPNRRPGIG
jgi:hypothetical protein